MQRSESNQERQFRSLLRWAVLWPAFSATAFSIYLYAQIRSLQYAGDRIWDSSTVISQAQLVQQRVSDASLDRDAATQVRPAILTLQTLTQDNPEQSKLVRALLRTEGTWFTSPWSEKHRFALRTTLRRLIRNEDEIRNKKIDAKDRLLRINLTTAFSAIILMCLITIYYVRRNLKRLSDFYQNALFDLESALKARDEFLSIASHELNTPLTSLRLQLQLGQRSLLASPAASPPLERIVKSFDISLRQTQRIADLVDDLLDVSRIQSGHLKYHFEPTDLAALLRSVAEREHDQLKRSGCIMTVQADCPILVLCDPFRFDQVISNLLSNAAKYGANKPVRVWVRAHEDLAELAVEDSGIGVPAGKEEMIFERFGRAVKDGAVTGLGLGLYITKQIVLGHQGTIELRSQEGRGSTFLIRIPLLASLPRTLNSVSAGITTGRVAESAKEAV